MKKLSVALLTLLVASLLANLPARAQNSSQSDMQSAGQESKSAAQDAGRAAAKTTDKAADKITGKIDINTSSSEELQKLPGVDAATADKIIAGRPYTNKGELLTRNIVSQKEYNAMRDSIVAHKATSK
jgi:competence protein ComEA